MEYEKNIRGVIFDIDGVLLDSLSIWSDLAGRYLRSQEKEPEPGLYEIIFSMSMEESAAYMSEHYGLGLSPEDVVIGLEDMLRDFYYNEVEAKPGALELMRFFEKKDLVMVAATSSPRDHVEHALKRTGQLSYLSGIFTNAEVGSSKSSPQIYDTAAEYMGIEPGEIIVFEDSLYALKTAAVAGYHTVGVFDEKGEPDQEGMKENAEIYIKSMEDFPKSLL